MPKDPCTLSFKSLRQGVLPKHWFCFSILARLAIPAILAIPARSVSSLLISGMVFAFLICAHQRKSAAKVLLLRVSAMKVCFSDQCHHC